MATRALLLRALVCALACRVALGIRRVGPALEAPFDHKEPAAFDHKDLPLRLVGAHKHPDVSGVLRLDRDQEVPPPGAVPETPQDPMVHEAKEFMVTRAEAENFIKLLGGLGKLSAALHDSEADDLISLEDELVEAVEVEGDEEAEDIQEARDIEEIDSQAGEEEADATGATTTSPGPPHRFTAEDFKALFVESLKVNHLGLRRVGKSRGFLSELSLTNQLNVFDAVARENATVLEFFAWLMSYDAEKMLRKHVGILSEELGLIRAALSTVAPPELDLEEYQAFDFVSLPWHENLRRARMGAQISAFLAVRVRSFATVCDQEIGVMTIKVSPRRHEGKTLLEAKLLGRTEEHHIPSLQPWFVEDVSFQVSYFGRVGTELTSYATDLLIPLLAWKRMRHRQEGILPGAIALRFEICQGEVVLRLARVVFRLGPHSLDLEPCCVGAERVSTLRRMVEADAREVSQYLDLEDID